MTGLPRPVWLLVAFALVAQLLHRVAPTGPIHALAAVASFASLVVLVPLGVAVVIALACGAGTPSTRPPARRR